MCATNDFLVDVIYLYFDKPSDALKEVLPVIELKLRCM